MNDTPANPFSRLDTNLMRSTKPSFSTEQPQQPPVPLPQPERPNIRTEIHSPTRRVIARKSFEIYEDQMRELRRFSYEEKMDGEIGSMSAMVREAIDTYIQKRNIKK